MSYLPGAGWRVKPGALMATQRESDHAPASDTAPQWHEGRDQTRTAQGETQEPVPREPFERDESADDAGEPTSLDQHRGRLAHEDLERGLADTSRSAEMDATYHRMRQAPETHTKPDAQDAPGLSPPAPPASRR